MRVPSSRTPVAGFGLWVLFFLVATATLVSAAAPRVWVDSQQNPLGAPQQGSQGQQTQQGVSGDDCVDSKTGSCGWMAPVVEAGAQGGRSIGGVVLGVVGAAGVFALGLV